MGKYAHMAVENRAKHFGSVAGEQTTYKKRWSGPGCLILVSLYD